MSKKKNKNKAEKQKKKTKKKLAKKVSEYNFVFNNFLTITKNVSQIKKRKYVD